MDPEADIQLDAIREVQSCADELGVSVWLRGGWAMDFCLGAVTRRHEDIDWFVPTGDLPRLTEGLVRLGWRDVGRLPPDQQRDLVRHGVEIQLVPLSTDGDGAPVVGGGPWRGAPWPADLTTGAVVGSVAGVTATAISPRAQVEIKERMPGWVPGMRRRAKDAADIARLMDYLGRHCRQRERHSRRGRCRTQSGGGRPCLGGGRNSGRPSAASLTSHGVWWMVRWW